MKNVNFPFFIKLLIVDLPQCIGQTLSLDPLTTVLDVQNGLWILRMGCGSTNYSVDPQTILWIYKKKCVFAPQNRIHKEKVWIHKTKVILF